MELHQLERPINEVLGQTTAVPNTSTGNRSDPQFSERSVYPAIEISNGYKQYGFWNHWRHVLRNLNMAVFEGEMCRPHGCGKSTAVNVILGLVKLDSGYVKVFGFAPGATLSGIPGIRVGYTPKLSGLYQDFTANEIFRYYGQCLGLSTSYISERIYFLNNLLNIPFDDKLIKYYSEGVKRQISFAVALLHEPDLLVLDEPCHGLDPILSRGIWEHMKELSKDNKTILLTTQNCDEARWSDKIGFMRNGQIVVQGDPRQLLVKYEEKTLERLYCRVYISNPDKLPKTVDEKDLVSLDPTKRPSEGLTYVGDELAGSSTHPSSISRRDGIDSLGKIRNFFPRYKSLHVLLKRDILITLRRYILSLVFVLVPALYLSLFCSAMGTEPSNLPLGIVNYEVPQDNCQIWQYMSCRFLWMLDKNVIDQRSYVSYEEAYDAVKNLDLWGLLLISQNCTHHFNQVHVMSHLDTKDDLSPPFVLMLDATSKVIASAIENAVKVAVRAFAEEATAASEKEYMENLFLEIRDPLFGTPSTPNVEFMAPGVTLTFIYHSVAFVLAVATVSFRIECVTVRNYLAGVRFDETVLSHMLVYGSFALFQSVILFTIMLPIFKMPNYGNLSTVSLIVILLIICGISFGIFIGMVASTGVEAGAYVFGSLVGSMILCVLSTGWDSSPTCLVGKTALVTGANTGIGLHIAQDFAKRGARVILACRDLSRGEEAKAKIIEATNNTNIEVKSLDLSSLASIRKFAIEMKSTEDKLHILVNNASVAYCEPTVTPDGLSLVMQVNHFGPFLLTILLLGLLKRSSPSRITMIASKTARIAKLDVADLNATSSSFCKRARHYANTKLCNILMANELSVKLKDTGISVNVADPGTVRKECLNHLNFAHRAIMKICNVFLKSTLAGAQTPIYVSVSKDLMSVSGAYFSDCSQGKIPKYSDDVKLGQQVWEKTEELLKLTPQEKQNLNLLNS
ncbi:hypothetical protein FQA39_LY13974 [Lamprigera yunnana]|nr:hypothetical protein FQA39_LY13974 [Lamprigera yunnana]